MDIDNAPLPALLAALGERLRAARLRANLTQQALADAAGVSVKTVANAEDGHNVSLETWLMLLRGVGRTDLIAALLEDEGPSPIDIARRRGRQRQRASGDRGRDEDGDDWQW